MKSSAVANEIISNLEMCRRESMSLQRGMNFDSGGGSCVILMPVRPNAPHGDRFQDDGTILICERHGALRNETVPNPKAVDPFMMTRGHLQCGKPQ